MDSSEFFKKENTLNESLYQKYKRQSTRLATLRLLVFIVELILFVYLINIRELAWALGSIGGFLFVFALLVKSYNRAIFNRNQHKFIANINQEESRRLNCEFDQSDTGIEYLEEDHPYAKDIDVFGKSSVFTLLNRTSTYPGKDLLAKRLLGKAQISNIPKYQTAVKEIAENIEFIQSYRALGMHIKSTAEDYKGFIDWLNSSAIVSNIRFIGILLWVLPLLFAVSCLLAFAFSVTYYVCLPFAILNGVFLAKYHNYASRVVEETSASVRLLKTYSHHLELIESREWLSPFLQKYNQIFILNGTSAKKEIRYLSSLLDNLQSRKNLLHVFINVPLLLDLQWLTRLEKWQNTNRSEILNWISGFAEMEVLISLAGQAFAESSWVYPKIEDNPYKLVSKNLGHPLIHRQTRISNNFTLEGEGQVVLLTGPNMAGKSTFLRTIAVNTIMAKIGGVVCASEFTMSKRLQIFTSMRTKDDLSESVSSFYAELARIKQLLDTIESKQNVLFFLDEILKGTNSEDRHKGAEALIRQLLSLKVTGFVSTHDIALGQLTKELDGVSNFSFESIIENNEISFDYKLKEGICQSFNACALMRKMGIEV